MELTANDSIARELVTSYDISFNIGYPAIIEKKSTGISGSIVHSYLTMLSKFPDTFIARKNGMDAAKKVSEDAGAVLDGKMDIDDFDAGLRSPDNRLNPHLTISRYSPVTNQIHLIVKNPNLDIGSPKIDPNKKLFHLSFSYTITRRIINMPLPGTLHYFLQLRKIGHPPELFLRL